MPTEAHKTNRIANILIAVITPIFLIVFAVRVMTTPTFARIEYNLPNFPEDSFGFSKAERLEYSRYAITYLTNNAEISYLGDLTFEDGSPLFNERELSHMEDVKALFSIFFNIWYGVTFALGGFLIWYRQTGKWNQFRKALGRGGIFTIGLLLLVGTFVAIDFNWFFTQFHHLFFESSTWLFYTSDTLIRLFPLPFWLHAVIGILAITLISSALLIWQANKATTSEKEEVEE